LRKVLGQPALHPVLPMVLEHELMHHETLMYMLEQLPSWARRPYPRGPADNVAGSVRRAGRIRIPAGPARLGAARDGRFRWDNEHPEHVVPTAAFEIDALPVTNRAFREFVASGGYAERRLWSDDAWRWLTRRPSDAPRLPAEAEDEWPAYVMHCEAQAFARFRGARLPSEAEFHRAAFATPEGGLRAHPWGDAAPGPEHGNLGFLRFSPAPVGAFPEGRSAFGVHELVGNGWEWTATPFRPFPGFEPLARYPGYSADFFDERHFVLLGASWATDARLVRRSFRNWFQPHYPYVFAKFRLAA
jgi:formylglycine-generating enzyme required for sulfatase activity